MFLVYRGDKELVVKGYVHASFDIDPDDSKPQSRYVFIVKGGVVSRCSSKQSVVVASTTKAEYIVASEAAQEAAWMNELMSELGMIPSASDRITIYCDNTGAIAITKEPRFHKKT